ncbi:MAG: hypothetical protein AB8B60_11865 [Sulfitobacter sp.]
MEAWPPELWDLTLPAIEINLSEQDRHIIGSATPAFAEMFDLPGRMPDTLACISEIGDAVNDLAQTGAFVRLGSASFKREGALSLPLETAEQFVDAIRAPNLRAARFVGDSLKNDYPLSLFVFPWHPIQEWAEFRLFVQGGRLAGVSQYHCETRFDELHNVLPEARTKIDAFWKSISAALPLPDVIIDVFIDTDGSNLFDVHLIELNPFIRRSDTCLFTFDKPYDFDGSFRVVT